jgi:hypothetical protein
MKNDVQKLQASSCPLCLPHNPIVHLSCVGLILIVPPKLFSPLRTSLGTAIVGSPNFGSRAKPVSLTGSFLPTPLLQLPPNDRPLKRINVIKIRSYHSNGFFGMCRTLLQNSWSLPNLSLECFATHYTFQPHHTSVRHTYYPPVEM